MSNRILISKVFFEEIYNTYRRELYITCVHYSKDEELSKEIVQEVFTSIWERKDKLEIHTTIQQYLYKTLKMKVFEHYRKAQVKLRYSETQSIERDEPETTSPEARLMYKELDFALSSVVKELPERCREVYKFSREHGLKNRAIARHLTSLKRQSRQISPVHCKLSEAV